MNPEPGNHTGLLRQFTRSLLLGVLLWAASAPQADAQYDKKWLSAGSLHNWYSEVGCESESQGFVGTQQDGLRWPGIYQYTDSQAAKGLWIGARDVTDQIGTTYAQRVVHVGPRVLGTGEFFPTKFEMVSRFDPPLVFVDGELSESEAAMANDRVDPTMFADRMIVNEVNTLLGLTMERKILQFSQDYHDNYHLFEYTFTNTGNTDDDADIELPNNTLQDLYIYFQWRWSVVKETRYVIGNGTGWGLNAMLDKRGDGVKADPSDEQFRAQFAWHGKFPPFTFYDNIGGPILPQALPALQVANTDTLGRLGASQFVGAVTIHADTAPDNPVDDVSQPRTTSWIGSDEQFTSNNDAFTPAKMQVEYNLMKAGHRSPRHADVVEPTGMAGWLAPTRDPSLGTPGGFSNANGYGPYTLGPGESVKIVMAEASAGLSREENLRVGKLFKDGAISALQKNQYVFQSRDSLFQTFRRAIANYESGYQIPRPPQPPSQFIVESGGDRISLTWDYPGDAPLPQGFEIYRASGRYDSTYTRVHTAAPGDRSFDDTTPIRGIDYYYYIVAVGPASANTGTALTPAGRPLRSSRYYGQTYTPARLKRQAGTSLEQVRIVPNPFNIGSSPGLRWPDQTDKLAFLNIPGRCTIQIFTEMGELIHEISHTDGSGDAFWDHTTSSRQVIVSGIYIAVITDLESGERIYKKLIIVR